MTCPAFLRAGIAALTCIIVATVKADTIELMNGNSVEGKVLATDATLKTITVEAVVGGQTITRTLPNLQVHALTVDGQRTVVTPKAGSPATPSGAAAAVPVTRTEAEVKALIAQSGATPPDWFKSTKLNYPKTLDLDWPQPPPGNKWDNTKNVGQFVWDTINPNEPRWREGIKLMDHILGLKTTSDDVRLRATKETANMYFRFFQDYARAAWWWEKAGLTSDEPTSVLLAECYWRLGCKQMALDIAMGQTVYDNTVKLLGDMGETDKAVELAQSFIPGMAEPHEVLVQAGDACRLAGRNDKAMEYYQKALDAPVDPSRKNRVQRTLSRAQASIDAIKLFDLSDVSKVADGTYTSKALGYEGDVQVTVKIKSKRIESVKITQHKEKQYYSAMRDVPEQIIAKQGVKGVDATSRATITGNAIINATAKALSEGAR